MTSRIVPVPAQWLEPLPLQVVSVSCDDPKASKQALNAALEQVAGIVKPRTDAAGVRYEFVVIDVDDYAHTVERAVLATLAAITHEVVERDPLAAHHVRQLEGFRRALLEQTEQHAHAAREAEKLAKRARAMLKAANEQGP